MEKPLSVAISVLIHEDKVLLFKRTRGHFTGMLSLPGGKVEAGEHIAETAVRELKEETNVDSDFKEYKGVVCEHLVRDGEFDAHFILHVCQLEAKTTELKHCDEGVPEWIDLNELEELKDKIVPSDYMMLKHLVLEKKQHYWESVMEVEDDEYSLVKFE